MLFAIPELAAQGTIDRRFRFAPTVGLNVSQVDGDTLAGFVMPGLQVGGRAYAMLDDKGRTSLSIGILYNQKGSRSTRSLFRQRLNYADIPILFNYHDKDRVIMTGGISVGRLVGAITRDRTGAINEEADDAFRQWDYNYVFASTFLVRRQLGITLQYSGSLAPITDGPSLRPNGKGQINRTITFGASWIFGGPVWNDDPEE